MSHTPNARRSKNVVIIWTARNDKSKSKLHVERDTCRPVNARNNGLLACDGPRGRRWGAFRKTTVILKKLYICKNIIYLSHTKPRRYVHIMVVVQSTVDEVCFIGTVSATTATYRHSHRRSKLVRFFFLFFSQYVLIHVCMYVVQCLSTLCC